jgi:putative DNA methylase
MMNTTYPKRLIEVDLPIKRISAHARREKSIRHGHISTLHIWWARRPLAACRAVICAALWPDPSDLSCPQAFRDEAMGLIFSFAKMALSDARLAEGCSAESWRRWKTIAGLALDPKDVGHQALLRDALLDFIADFANWDNATKDLYLRTSRALTEAAHLALGGELGSRPLIIDPFAGGGAIPFEGLRIGADVFASDLNPVATLLNKVLLEYAPNYGRALVDEVRKWGTWVKERVEHELMPYYPVDPDGSRPIAYLWARTIISEAPGDGKNLPVEVPLLGSMWLAKRQKNSVAVRWSRDETGQVRTQRVTRRYADGTEREVRQPILEIFRPIRPSEVIAGTVARGSATCPVSGYTTPVASVRQQLRTRSGGSRDARLYAVVTARASGPGRDFRLPSEADLVTVRQAVSQLEALGTLGPNDFPIDPGETLPLMSGVFNAPIYGHSTWGSLFTQRQLLAVSTFAKVISLIPENGGRVPASVIRTFLAIALDRVATRCTAQCIWDATTLCIMQIFNQGQSLPVRFEFAEMTPLSDDGSGWETTLRYSAKVMEAASAAADHGGTVLRQDAKSHALPDGMASAVVTDPPYYNSVPYADLSDFFYVWLKRTIRADHPTFFSDELSPKDDEICEMSGWDPDRYGNKDKNFFEQSMKLAMSESRRVLSDHGIAVVAFAHKSTEGWEAQLQAMIDSG